MAKAAYPESSNNLIGVTTDPQVFKYESKTASIGTCPRFGSGVNQPDYDGFPPGAVSPGPMRYKPSADSTYCHRMSHCPGADNIPPRYSIRKKTKIIELESQTPAKVGPGQYPIAEACGAQPSSEKPSRPQWSFSKKPRFPEPHVHGAQNLWHDGDGKRAQQFNRSYSTPASYSFGTSTRGHRKKVGNIITAADK